MCGRYTLAAPNPAIVRERFGLGAEIPLEPRFNVAPTQDVLAITTDREGAPRPQQLHWGLVPHWAEGPAVGARMINARAETLTQRPAFRDAFAQRRCLILADGFYEWQPRGSAGKQPWWITRADHAPFAFAGLWSTWRSEPGGEPLRSCTIITTEASEPLREIHGRMPVILERADEQRWLDHEADAELLRGLLVPFAAPTRTTPVSSAVNSADHDAADCIEPVPVLEPAPAEPTLF